MSVHWCSSSNDTKLAPIKPPIRPQVNIKLVAIARILVGYTLTDIPIVIAAQDELLTIIINELSIEYSSVIWFKKTEQRAEIVSQVTRISRVSSIRKIEF